jgi:hypothetical protein
MLGVIGIAIACSTLLSQSGIAAQQTPEVLKCRANARAHAMHCKQKGQRTFGGAATGHRTHNPVNHRQRSNSRFCLEELWYSCPNPTD